MVRLFLYGTAAALIFNKLFFPTCDPMVGTLLVGAAARPDRNRPRPRGRPRRQYGAPVSFLAELFGTKVRYSGVSLGYNLASIFAGALSPLIAVWLMAEFKPATWPISVYMIILAVITLVSVYFAVETRKKPA